MKGVGALSAIIVLLQFFNTAKGGAILFYGKDISQEVTLTIGKGNKEIISKPSHSQPELVEILREIELLESTKADDNEIDASVKKIIVEGEDSQITEDDILDEIEKRDRIEEESKEFKSIYDGNYDSNESNEYSDDEDLAIEAQEVKKPSGGDLFKYDVITEEPVVNEKPKHIACVHKQVIYTASTSDTIYQNWFPVPTNSNRFEFDLRSNRDAFIVMSEYPVITRKEPNNAEFNIGCCLSSKIQLRVDGDSIFYTLFDISPPVSNPKDFNKFWISWDNEGKYSIGYQGLERPLVSRTHHKGFTVNYIGIRNAYGGNGTWIVGPYC